jgi:pimeloyl-ACP methyl ester carboxylesterase
MIRWFPQEMLTGTREKIVASRVVIISNTGHIFPIENPEKTVEVISEFLG